MHIIAWLLGQRSHSSSSTALNARHPERLGGPTETELNSISGLPGGALTRIEASLDLYARVARLDCEMKSHGRPESPARALMDQLARAF
jgi:regulator of CtrA degradation